MDRIEFFEATQRFVHAHVEYTRERTAQTEKEWTDSFKVIYDEVVRVEQITRKQAKQILPNLNLDKLV